MKNEEKVVGGVQVDLGHRVVTIEFTNYSAIQYRKLTGKNLLAGEIEGTDPELLAALVWVGLLDGMPDLDGVIDSSDPANRKPSPEVEDALTKVSKWMKFRQYPAISNAIRDAFNQAKPEVKPEPVDSKKKAAADPSDQKVLETETTGGTG